jgi:hypothetical protein
MSELAPHVPVSTAGRTPAGFPADQTANAPQLLPPEAAVLGEQFLDRPLATPTTARACLAVADTENHSSPQPPAPLQYALPPWSRANFR